MILSEKSTAAKQNKGKQTKGRIEKRTGKNYTDNKLAEEFSLLVLFL